MNEILRRKIKAHVKRTEIKSFGYRPQDLDAFTLQELIELNEHGLIGNEDVSNRRMKNGL